LFKFAFYSDDMSLLMTGLKSQAAINKSVGWKFKDCLAEVSTLSFPCIPTWIGNQYNLTVFVFYVYHEIVKEKTFSFKMFNMWYKRKYCLSNIIPRNLASSTTGLLEPDM
jgi:hypothetical protein